MSKTLPYEQSAERMTGISGWVCKTCRRFFGDDEHLARYCCAKDLPCDKEGCKNRKERGYTVCEPCGEAMRFKRWMALPEIAWDGETPLHIDDDDRYFFTADDLDEYLADHDVDLEDLRLVICEPVSPPHFDMYYFLDDHLAEGMEDVADWDKINKTVNAWIKKNVPRVWGPGKKKPTVASVRSRVSSQCG